MCSAGSRGVPSLVYDPVNPDGMWGRGSVVVRDPDRFCDAFWRSRGCLVVIDEFPSLMTTHRDEVRGMLLRGRHINPETGGGGHDVIVIGNRWTLIDKSAREQCSRLYALKQGVDDAVELARHWACPELVGVSKLGRFEYMKASAMQFLGTGKVVPPQRRG